MTTALIVEHLARRAMQVPNHHEVVVVRVENQDAWIATWVLTGKRYYVDGLMVLQMMKDAKLQAIHEQVTQEQRGWLLFEGWRTQITMTPPQKRMTPPQHRAAQRWKPR